MTIAAGHQALRTGRVSLRSQIYLLTTVTADRSPLFAEVELARVVCRLMIERSAWGDAQLLCWVLMPDHWHGLLELGSRDDLSLVMNRFKSMSSKQIRRTRQIRDVWARGFHDHALRCDERLRQAARYVVANPIRAGLVRRAGDYPYWSCVWL